MKRTLKKYFIPHEHNEYKPHFLRGKSVAVLIVIIFLIFGFSILQYEIITNTNLASIISSVLVDMANGDRQTNNEAFLKINPLLTKAAQMKADDMAQKGYFSHTSPDGITPWYWFRVAGYNFEYAGENLAINFYDSQDVETAWMNSLKHRENILNGNFTEIGIATAKGIYQGRETIFVVQLFGRPQSNYVPSVPSVPPAQPAPVVVLPAEPAKSESFSVSKPPNVQNDTFVVVKGEKRTEPVSEEITDQPQKVSYASFPEEMAASPRKTLSYSYIILGIIVFIALLLFITIEIRKQYPRHILYALLLLFIMASVVYINHTYLFPQVLVK